MNRLAILLLSLLLATDALAQSPVGTWKRTTMLLTEANGKTTDMAPELTKTMPCTKDITYSFVADGTMRVNVPESCGVMKLAIERVNKSGRWTISGGKITIVVLDKNLPDSDYDLTISGNTMTWSFNYANNPQMPNPTKAKRMVIKYVRS